MYSQNNEEEFILKFFGNRIGAFLDIGAHDGIGNSNTYQLGLNGWRGACVEPSPSVFPILKKNYEANTRVFCWQAAIAERDGQITFWDSEGDQLGTISSAQSEKVKSLGYSLKETTCDGVTVKTFLKNAGATMRHYEFISIDAEGVDIMVLKQLAAFDFCYAKMVCIECDGPKRDEIISYLQPLGFNVYHTTGENLLMTR